MTERELIGATVEPTSLEGAGDAEQQEGRRRTLAVRLDENTHAKLAFIAQLGGSSIADEIRRSIEGRIAAAQDDPDLIARAAQVQQQIEREARARAAAIAGFLGSSAVAGAGVLPASTDKKTPSRTRRQSGSQTS